MKTVSKKLFSLLLVAILLVSLLPMQAFATSAATVKFYNYNWNGTYSHVATYNVNAPTMINGLVPEITAPSGWRFAGWVEYTEGMTFDAVNAKTAIDLMKYLCQRSTSYAPKFVKDTGSITFDAVMPGVAAPKSITVTNGRPFSDGGDFPMIYDTVTGYTFGGWKYGDINVNASNWSTTVYNSATGSHLTAIWIPDEITVNFYAWSGSDYAIIAQAKAKYGEYLKASDVPTTGLDGRYGYDANGWQTTAGTDAVAVVPTSVKLTGTTSFYVKYVGETREVTLNYDRTALGAAGKMQVRIGEAYGQLPTPTLAGETFIGWFNGSGNQVTAESIFWDTDVCKTLTARWGTKADVRLTILDKDTGKTIKSELITGGAKGFWMSVSDINIASILPTGNTYKLLGYMDKTGYTEYLVNKVINPVQKVFCVEQGTTEIYAVVSVVSSNDTGSGNNTGNNTGSGNNNTGNGNTGSNKPADPTNPATGDNSMIVASVTVMTLSAAALVVFMQLRKRKMI